MPNENQMMLSRGSEHVQPIRPIFPLNQMMLNMGPEVGAAYSPNIPVEIDQRDILLAAKEYHSREEPTKRKELKLLLENFDSQKLDLNATIRPNKRTFQRKKATITLGLVLEMADLNPDGTEKIKGYLDNIEEYLRAPEKHMPFVFQYLQRLTEVTNSQYEDEGFRNLEVYKHLGKIILLNRRLDEKGNPFPEIDNDHSMHLALKSKLEMLCDLYLERCIAHVKAFQENPSENEKRNYRKDLCTLREVFGATENGDFVNETLLDKHLEFLRYFTQVFPENNGSMAPQAFKILDRASVGFVWAFRGILASLEVQKKFASRKN